VTLTEAEELSKVSLENKVVLFRAFHRRYNKNLLKVIDKLKSMPIVHVEGNYLDNVEKHLIGIGLEWYVKMKSAGSGIIMVNGPNIYDPIIQFLGHLKVTGVDIKRVQEHDLDMVVIRMDCFFEGERKDVIVKFKDGTEYIVDMLAGSEAFKSSMWHEYEDVIEDFCARIDLCRMCYDNKTSMKDVPIANAVNLDLHGREAVDIVRLVCNTYAKEIRQE
jgi:predicted dehydrogenase